MNRYLIPPKLLVGVDKVGLDRVLELRLRSGQPLAASLISGRVFVGQEGICAPREAYYVVDEDIDCVVKRACRSSVYRFDRDIAKGYINAGKGVRIGLCGETVTENGKIVTVKRIMALNIRFPHQIIGCSNKIDITPPQSTLVIGVCGSGKTTLLRDLAQRCGNVGYNVSVLDERGEIMGFGEGKCAFDCLGIDVFANCPKTEAYENAIRSMAPDVIVTDEIGDEDIGSLKRICNSGAAVFASLHASDIREATDKCGEVTKVFKRFVLLKGVGKPIEIQLNGD